MYNNSPAYIFLGILTGFLSCKIYNDINKRQKAKKLKLKKISRTTKNSKDLYIIFKNVKW